MTDTPDTPETSETATRRAATPGAAAASRARRIGGRPVPGPVATERPAAGQPAEPAQPVVLTKDEPAQDGPSVAPPPAAPREREAGGQSVLPIADGAPPAVPAWLNWAPAGVLVAGCLVMAILLAIFSHGVWWGPDRGAAPSRAQVNQQREQVLAAAKSCVVAANDYDYQSLPAYEKRALACTTGQLTAKLQQTIESLIMKNAPRIKAKQSTQISRGGIETVTPDGRQWTLLVFGQLSVVNANYPKGRTDPFGAEVRMEKAHGKWVMSQLTVVSSPARGG